ncbi:DUF3107 domain-containing protein [Rhodococcus rhodnii]|uniref:DUF3107 domain-containing protein n=1 Tax=Rhodococcus rhodnii TaxID=38312 RepID=A0A6P2CH96_9NOCA|nr:DUF3107 domain-containing protein [Rhodococcus rhodnii]TXG90606.1 DUF3107 domain-containing protein [Rhodococcus rhodnii]
MEVKIGLVDSPRELVVSSSQTSEEVEKLVSGALENGAGVISLVDDKGRKYLIQASKIGYVEIGATDSRKVGFGAS